MNEPIQARPTCLFHGKRYTVDVNRFTDNGNACVILLDDFGTMQLRVSVNLGPLNDAFTYIKDYSENRGIAKALSKLLTPTGLFEHSGSQRIYQYKLGAELQACLGIVPDYLDDFEETAIDEPATFEVDDVPDDDMPADATAGVPDPEDEDFTHTA